MLGIGLGYSRGGAATAEPWYAGQTTVPTSSGSATVTADPTAHTKGAWVEIIASNAAETSVMAIRITGISQNAVDTASLLDIGVGASGSENVIVGDVAIGGAANVYQVIPIRVASGSRIAARIQSVITGGKTGTIEITTFAAGDASLIPTSVDVLGTSTATSEGTFITGSYTEIVASSSQLYKAIGVIESATTTNLGITSPTIILGVGASGSETEVHHKLILTSSSESVSTAMPNVNWITDVNIVAGSRISAKTTVGSHDVTIIGVPA